VRVAIVGGTVWTGDGTVIRDGVVVIDGDRIEAVGQDGVPKGATEVSARGRYVLPGYVDAHAHAGLVEEGVGWEGQDGNELTDPVTPQLRALDGINPQDGGLARGLAAGVTTVHVTPGSGNVVGGQGAVVRTWGTTVDAMVLRAPAGIKAALGENPKRVYRELKRMPTTRMGTAAVLRDALARARAYVDKLDKAGGDAAAAPERDLRWEALALVIRRRIPLRVHCHRADDILTALRIRREFDIDITLEHAVEGHLVAAEIAAAGVPVSYGPLLAPVSKVEVRGLRPDAPAILTAAGIEVSLITDHPVVPLYALGIQAGIAVREGLSEQAALRAITLHPARSLGVADQVGSLAPGKAADVAIWQGHPFEVRSRVRRVFVRGELAHRR
jgi:imidazolonepropionase-like amidohydrolase